jgi:polar amino acid transport system substrate-binding protein
MPARARRRPLSSALIVLICLLLCRPAAAQQLSPPSRAALRVGVAGSAPFVVDLADQQGIALEIWQQIAARLGWRYRLIGYGDVPSALAALDSGAVDVVVGPVSITADREQRVRFTQPFYQSSISILARAEPPGWWRRIRPFFSWHFFAALGIFCLILAGVGTLLWLTERRHNPTQFPAEPAAGIGNGMWLAIVTMSTTGYGDRAPVTLAGRLVTAAWIVISLAFATTMIAGIASTLTLSGLATSSIEVADDLPGRTVAVEPDSPASELVARYHARAVPITSPEQGYRLLRAHQVEAVVYDRPQLLYFLKAQRDRTVAISAAEYMRQGYGFALPLSSTAVHQIDIALLRMEESGQVGRIVGGWISSEAAR